MRRTNEPDRATRMALIAAEQEAQQARRAQELQEHNDFVAAARARRDAILRGEEAPARPPDLNQLMLASLLQQQEAERQRRLQYAASEQAWNAEGMSVPPHVQQARKTAMFEQMNAEYLAEQEAIQVLRLQSLQEQEA